MILDKIILHAPMSFEFILVCYILNLYMVYVDLGNKDRDIEIDIELRMLPQ